MKLLADLSGFTPQYTGLEELYKTYGPRGLEVVGFPSNEFLSQEPGTDDDIAEFCQVNHGVTFPLASKVSPYGRVLSDTLRRNRSHCKHCTDYSAADCSV